MFVAQQVVGVRDQVDQAVMAHEPFAFTLPVLIRGDPQDIEERVVLYERDW
jgi:hypothetical protein